MRDLTFFRL